MVLYALVAVETPNASPTERITFAHALQHMGYGYGHAAHTFRIAFVASLDEARQHLADQMFPDDPDYTFEDYVQAWAYIAADRDAAAALILADVRSAATTAGLRTWKVDLQMSDKDFIAASSDD